MKSRYIITVCILALLSGTAYTQNVDDALRYSQLFYNGTARFNAMGGAFTALGGDLSTLSQNPAGLGVFRSSEFTISPQMFSINTNAGLNGSRTEDYMYNFGLGQGGLVLNLVNNSNQSGLLNLNFGYAFSKTNNLYQTIVAKGIGENSSMADYWADLSGGYFKDELADNVPEAYLAFDTWIIDTLSGSNTQYGTVFSYYGDDPPSVYGQTMRRITETTGYTGEHTLSIGGNYSDKIIFGASLGISRISYIHHYEHLEQTDAALSSKFTNFNYTFHYSNTGTGFGLKFGAIFKPVEIVRLGVAFHSPTVYRINEYVYDNITSGFSDGLKYEQSNSAVRYNYALTTPFRALAGAAVQLQKFGLVSVDYEFVDYRAARFSETGDGYDYGEKNHSIKSSLNKTSNLRLGGEFRLNKIYLRGGYGYYGNPFAADDINGDMHYNSFSAGAGFREQNFFVDFGFTGLTNQYRYVLYDSVVETMVSDIDINRKMFTLTFGYKFAY